MMMGKGGRPANSARDASIAERAQWVALRHAAEDLAALRELKEAGLVSAATFDALRAQVTARLPASDARASSANRSVTSLQLWNEVRSIGGDLRALRELESANCLASADLAALREELLEIWRRSSAGSSPA